MCPWQFVKYNLIPSELVEATVFHLDSDFAHFPDSADEQLPVSESRVNSSNLKALVGLKTTSFYHSHIRHAIRILSMQSIMNSFFSSY
ncbi:hypothetical protein WAI453_013618 [Rhynchosporium graminicola]